MTTAENQIFKKTVVLAGAAMLTALGLSLLYHKYQSTPKPDAPAPETDTQTTKSCKEIPTQKCEERSRSLNTFALTNQIKSKIAISIEDKILSPAILHLTHNVLIEVSAPEFESL
jgi:hypothetical protein